MRSCLSWRMWACVPSRFESSGKCQPSSVMESSYSRMPAREAAGAFAIVIELVPRDIARMITTELQIPTIGIGAGPDCDGQVLVSPDMLGLTPGFNPRYLKKFAELHEVASQAVRQYVSEVATGAYPDAAHSHE